MGWVYAYQSATFYLGHSHGGVEQTIPQTKSEPEVQEDLNVEK